MKNQIAISKKDLFRKRKAKHSADMRITLQLYAFHKAEAVIKKEPSYPEMIREDVYLRPSTAYLYRNI
jgi:hypothetical protein